MNPTNQQLRRAFYLIAAMLIASGVLGQTADKWKPTEVESLRLQVAQKDAVIAQQALTQAQSNFQAALDRLHAEAERVRVENKWPDTVKFNDQTVSFFEVLKTPEKAPEKK